MALLCMRPWLVKLPCAAVRKYCTASHCNFYGVFLMHPIHRIALSLKLTNFAPENCTLTHCFSVWHSDCSSGEKTQLLEPFSQHCQQKLLLLLCSSKNGLGQGWHIANYLSTYYCSELIKKRQTCILIYIKRYILKVNWSNAATLSGVIASYLCRAALPQYIAHG